MGALGLVLGLGASIACSGRVWITGCGSTGPAPDLKGGQRFALNHSGSGASDYELRASADAQVLIETSTEGGKRYEIRYAVEDVTKYED